jgi:UDP:flavonoid glycosyltransferase YjiC (YdhE family)
VAKRVVLACWGSYGDLFPYLAIALRLKALGHEPVLATVPFYRGIVEGEGIPFHPMRPDVNPDDRMLLRRVMDPARGTEVIVRELVVPAVRQAFEDLLDVAAGADLVVSHPITFAAPLAAEVLRVPWLSSVLAPTSMFSVHDFPLLPPHPALLRAARLSPLLARGFMKLAHRITGPWTAPVRQFRAELGLPDRGDPLYEGQFSPHGTLALFSEMFGAPQRDWPLRTKATGFVFYGQRSSPLPDDVAAFLEDGPAPVVFTLGSSAVNAPGEFYAESAKAATRAGRRALLLVGRELVDRKWPASVLAAEYAPHHLVFPRAAAVVHHGGIGTTAQVLAAGRPMLVVPHAHDQPDNAYRAVKLGVARSLDARRYTASRAAADLEQLLEKSSYEERARAVAQGLAHERGAETACEVILDRAAAARAEIA